MAVISREIIDAQAEKYAMVDPPSLCSMTVDSTLACVHTAGITGVS